MRIFDSVTECFSEVLRDMWAKGVMNYDATIQGIRGESLFEYKELRNYTVTVIHPTIADLYKAIDWWHKNVKRHVTRKYLEDWFVATITGANESEVHLEHFKSYWKNLVRNNNLPYEYSDRVDLNIVIEMLQQNPYRRAAFIPVFRYTDLRMSMYGLRVPCTIGYHVRIIPRPDPEVDVITLMRSCDLLNFFPLDMGRSILLQKEIVRRLKSVSSGNVTMFISSLHAYTKDIPKNMRW